MALIGTISGSVGAGGSLTSANAITGTLVVANVSVNFPPKPPDAVFFVSGSTTDSNTKSVFGGDLQASGTITALGYLKSLNSSGDEGGEIFLSKSVTGTTINGGVTIDVYQNKLRIFEQGGTARGGYFDITALDASAGTDLAFTGSSNAYTTTVGSPFTLAIPAGARIIEIEACGGGGGGGSGRKNPAANGCYGGGGGAGGAYSRVVLNAATVRAISSNLTITIGGGGAGGAAQISDSTNGNPGNPGNNTSVAAGATTLLVAPGGSSGQAGTNTNGLGGIGPSWYLTGGNGGGSSNTAAPNQPPLAGFAGGGGAGGGVTTVGTALNGGNGGHGGDLRVDNVSRTGAGGNAATPRNGTNATVTATYSPTGGGGGGGGAGRNGGGGAAGTGGNGIQGSGGGGGGGNIDGASNDSGKGGDGGAGWCVVRFS